MEQTTNGVAAPQLQGSALLNSLINTAKDKVGGVFFDITNAVLEVSETGNTGFKCVTECGKTITWWESYDKSGLTMFDCIEEVQGNRFRVVLGATLSKPNALKHQAIIPKGSRDGGFWSNK